MAVVGPCGPPTKGLLSSKLLTEAGGLRGTSSDLRADMTEVMEADNLLSVEGLVNGGGMLMEGLFIVDLLVDASTGFP